MSDRLRRHGLGVAHHPAHAADRRAAVVVQDAFQHHLRRHRVVDALNRRAAGSLILRMRRAESVKTGITQTFQQGALINIQTLGADSQLAAGVGAVPKPGLHPGQIIRCHQQICLANAVAGMRLSRPAPIQPSKLRQTLRAA